MFEDKKDGRTVLACATEWADAAVAKEFFGLYRKVLRGKWKNMDVSSENDTRLAGRADDGYFIVRLEGARVTSLEGLKSPGEARESLR